MHRQEYESSRSPVMFVVRTIRPDHLVNNAVRRPAENQRQVLMVVANLKLKAVGIFFSSKIRLLPIFPIKLQSYGQFAVIRLLPLQTLNALYHNSLPDTTKLDSLKVSYP